MKRIGIMNTEGNGVKVLIVDDDKNIREVTSYLLKNKGFTVDCAENGIEALDKVSKQKPTVIILDVSMPYMGGLETCSHLRANPETQNIPIIFLTAEKYIAAITEYIPGAAVEYIEKPCTCGHLIKQIKSIISK